MKVKFSVSSSLLAAGDISLCLHKYYWRHAGDARVKFALTRQTFFFTAIPHTCTIRSHRLLFIRDRKFSIHSTRARARSPLLTPLSAFLFFFYAYRARSTFIVSIRLGVVQPSRIPTNRCLIAARRSVRARRMHSENLSSS